MPGSSPPTKPRVLIVCHGAGRARPLPTLDEALATIERTRPILSGWVRLHATGSGEPPNLEGLTAVWFWLADPLREAYPACFDEAVEIADAARARGLRLVNPPEALSNTIKSTQSRVWKAAGFVTPQWQRFADRQEMLDLSTGHAYPAIVRADELHAQQGMVVVRSARELARLEPGRLRWPGAIAPLVDTRQTFRAAGHRSVWARYFHKKRALVLGSRVDPRSVLFSKQPIVGLKTCTYRPFRKRWKRPYHVIGPWTRRSIDADNAWSASAEPHAPELRAAADALGLRCAAIDYATTAEEGLVLWEANPYFYMPRADRFLLPRQRRFEARRERAHTAIAEFLCELGRDATSTEQP